MSVTIKELVEVCAEEAGITKAAAERILETAFTKITSHIQAGEEVVIRNFGRFSTKVRAARAGRNPKTGEAIQIDAKTVIKFAPRGSLLN